MVSAANPDGGGVSYAYDAGDRIAGITDPAGLSTTYSYDDLGRLSRAVSPAAGETVMTYDPAGNMVTRQDARGVIATLTHDALGRLTAVSYPDPSENVLYTYDQGPNGIGRLTGRIDASGQYGFTYDARGQLLTETRTVLGQTFVTEYLYTLDGDLKKIFFPSGSYVLEYVHDAAGRVSRVSITENDVTTVLADNVGYLPFGRDIDGPGVLKAVLAASLPRSYEYDSMDRLTRAQGTFGTYDYAYDRVGARLSKTENARTFDYHYDAAGRVTSVDGPAPISYTYDAAGNAITRADMSLSYNQNNRLAEASNAGGVVARYTYNALAQRVVKEAGGRQRIFLYYPSGELLADELPATEEGRRYVYLNGQPLAMIQSGTTPLTERVFYYANSHLGTPVAMTDHAGSLVWTGYYEPFGNAHLANTNTLTNNLRFPGQYHDDETGLHYNWHRYYDPDIGRYLRVDPIGLEGGMNLYVYAENNPIKLIDPFGTESCSCEEMKACEKACEKRGGVEFCGKIHVPIFGDFGGCKCRGDDCEKQAQRDETICRRLKDPAVRARCWASANERYGACRAARPLPPLVTW